MTNNIHLHKGDIPENLNLGNRIAVDGEFMGLNVRRDPLCLIQLSSGDSSAHIIQFDRSNYNSPNLTKILNDENGSYCISSTFIKLSRRSLSFMSPTSFFKLTDLAIFFAKLIT